MKAPCPARENPFRAERLHKLPFLPFPAAENQVFDALTQLKMHGALVGPHGSGKTTLLLRLIQMVQAQNIPTFHLQCQEDSPSLSSMDWNSLQGLHTDTVIFMDGAEFLGRLQLGKLKRLARRKGGVIATSHTPLVEIPTVYSTQATSQRLGELIDLLYPAEVSPEQVEALYDEHSGNLREALRDLYDCCAGGWD